MIIKVSYLRMKPYSSCNKHLKVKDILYIPKKSIRLHKVVMMIKDYKFLIELEHIKFNK